MATKLKLEDLKIGMKVHIDQLSEIYDTWIFLEKEYVGSNQGIIRYVGKETNKESQRIWESAKVISPIFNNSLELEEDIIFDE